MPQLHPPLSSATVLDHGRPAEESPFLSIDPTDDLGVRGTHGVFIVLEPVVESEYAVEVAEEVIEHLRAELDRRRDHTATAALLSAIELTNAWLVQANGIRQPEERVQFGLTCVVARGDELYIAQIAPSQILIAQEGELYAFPELDSWRWHKQMDDEEMNQPLGIHEETQPELYHTRIDAGDTLVLCSGSLASVIEREPQDVFVEGDADTVMAHLNHLARAYGVGDAHAAVIEVPQHAFQSHGETDLLQRVTSWCSNFLPEETAQRFRNRTRSRQNEVDLERSDVQTHEYPEDVSSYETAPGSGASADMLEDTGTLAGDNEGQRERWTRPESQTYETYVDDVDDDDYWDPGAYAEDDAPEDENTGQGRKRTLSELLAGAVLALSAAVVGVWQIAVHRDRSMGRPRDDGTLGLPRLQRYNDSMHMPDFTGVRRRMPRVPISRLTFVVSLVLILAVAATLAYSIQSSREQERLAAMESHLEAAVVQRQQAGEATDPATANAFLLASEARLQEAAALGLDAERLGQERAANAAQLDQALSIERLTNIQLVGGVPAAPDGVTPRIFFGNGQLYVFTDALYRLEADGSQLIRLLGTGDQVGESTVGTLQSAAWGDGAPIAFDGNSAYLLDPTTATWTRQEVGNFGNPFSGVVGINGYVGNLYLLTPGSGQILRFGAGAYAEQPEDWTAGQAAEELRAAVDIEIDGRIYVLLNDGRILDFYMSALENTYTPQLLPQVSNAVALSAQPERPYFYIADEADRIVRLNRDGSLVQQFMAADDAQAMAGIRDIAVDDGLGVAYVLTDQALLTMRLPGPPQ